MILGAALALTLAAPAKVSLTASPARVELVGRADQAVRVASVGPPVAVDVAVAGYALDLRGRPRILGARRDAAPWVTVRPRHRVIGRSGALFRVASAPPRGTRAGDHAALVLLTATAAPNGGVAVRMRLGVVVIVRVPGAIAQRLQLLRVRVRPARRARVLELALANRGSVTESITPRSMTITLRRGARVLARLRPPTRTLLPHSRGLLELRYSGPVRGRASLRVELLRPGGRRVIRSYPLRL